MPPVTVVTSEAHNGVVLHGTADAILTIRSCISRSTCFWLLPCSLVSPMIRTVPVLCASPVNGNVAVISLKVRTLRCSAAFGGMVMADVCCSMKGGAPCNGCDAVTNQIAMTTFWNLYLWEPSCCCCGLQATEYTELSVLDRALVLEALVTIVANTELLRNHLRHLEPEGSTPLLNRGAIMGRDAAGNIYHQLGGQSARCVLLYSAPALLKFWLHQAGSLPHDN